MRTLILLDEVDQILEGDTIIDTSTLAPLGIDGEGECGDHAGCRSL
ncbi:MAG: hypothetical protein ABI435_09285 [Pseudolysinimonas sp.]